MQVPIWQPSATSIESAQITRFGKAVGFDTYEALHRWSVTDKDGFWRKLWNFCDVSGDPGEVGLANADAMPGARFFPEGRLNFGENLLRFRDQQTAIISLLENGIRRTLSYAQLYDESTALATWFAAKGIRPSDRIAAFMPNIPETVIAMLATTSIGATFSSCSPDFGIQGVLDRFGQIAPGILVCANGYFYNGRTISSIERIEAIVKGVKSIEQVIIVDVLGDGSVPQLDIPTHPFIDAVIKIPNEFEFEPFPFDHPLYVMYSSGTTGVPKCIVHGAGGTLLQHLKEHRLHADLRRGDIFFYFTTCGWMMWNWLASGLATGSTLVLYDGSPFYPHPRTMMDIAERERITVFGTSAKYIASLQKVRVKPRTTHDLSQLRLLLSTGSPLSPESYRFVYRDLKQDVCLSSISGGTDILSCFVLGNPTLPVYEGELQCIGLGMDVHIFDETGNAVVEQKGELVCTSPFPSMPIGFWNDSSGDKYLSAYFTRFPGIWAQGDYGEITKNGGLVIHGRSDAVLNPGGVRIGTAEIYRQVEKVDDVLDAVCVGQAWDDDLRVVLFVVLRDNIVLTDELRDKIKRIIRENTTPRHVPDKILSVPDIPKTISGKIVELAVREAIHGREVDNTDALANPEALAYFRDRPELAER